MTVPNPVAALEAFRNDLEALSPTVSTRIPIRFKTGDRRSAPLKVVFMTKSGTDYRPFGVFMAFLYARWIVS